MNRQSFRGRVTDVRERGSVFSRPGTKPMTAAGSKPNNQADTAALLQFANALKQVESKVRVVPYTAQACIELHTKLASLEASLEALTKRVQEQEIASADRPSSTPSVRRARVVVPAVILLGLGLG